MTSEDVTALAARYTAERTYRAIVQTEMLLAELERHARQLRHFIEEERTVHDDS